MPKQVFKIEQFHGGLNTSADPRDILESEVSDITNAMLDEVPCICDLPDHAQDIIMQEMVIEDDAEADI